MVGAIRAHIIELCAQQHLSGEIHLDGEVLVNPLWVENMPLHTSCLQFQIEFPHGSFFMVLKLLVLQATVLHEAGAL